MPAKPPLQLQRKSGAAPGNGMHAPLFMQGLRMLQVLALSWQSGPVKVVGHVQV